MRKADPRTYFPDCSGNNSASTNKLTSAKLNDVGCISASHEAWNRRTNAQYRIIVSFKETCLLSVCTS